MEHSVDPDQLASKKPADLTQHCLQKRIYLGSAGQYLSGLPDCRFAIFEI